MIISGLLLSGADYLIDADGDRQAGLYFSKYESSIHAEYGLTSRWTVVLQLAVQQISQDNNGAADTASGLSASRIGLQARVWQHDRWVVSVQGSAVIPGGGENVADRPLGDGANGVEIRALAGRSISNAGFADIQYGYTLRSDDYPSEQRLDLTAGWRLADRYSVMLQSFNTISGADRQRNNRSFSQHKLQLSAGIRIRNGELVVGAFTTIHGRNSIDESGWTVSWWRRF
ncbi:hypothetical protein V0U79_12480 [Hyphobacterium sp. HN65]|uniref:Uncharacterized protein n=1 Tax=Hyphobacterium lacteum TaxID=3116575 RepID=A0ABU7LTE3_9PROT|nr:hypothetical protein [Hyphobacterium sp. HN65]MEE2527185.1 hypothetical protein [Hyphobacterium sp. HN65]